MQRNCTLENIRQEIYGKIWSQGYCVQTTLDIPVLLFSRCLKIGVNFAFVLTPKSAVKSSRRTRRKYSTITISMGLCITDQYRTDIDYEGIIKGVVG